MEEYEIRPGTLAAIAARHGVPADAVRPVPAGVANHTFLLGGELVLRVPRADRFLPDLVTEAAVIPLARGAGVRTPEIVAFDDTRSSVDVPYMILVRAEGVDLARLGLPADAPERVYRQVGRELAKLHQLSLAPPGSLPALTPAGLPAVPVDDDGDDPRVLVDRLASEGRLDTEAARWLTGWFDRLAEYLPAEAPPTLVHGDIAPQNLMVSPYTDTDTDTVEFSSLVDWGDAMWADAATEFAKVPLVAVPAVLEGYRQETGAGLPVGAGRLEARVLRCHLAWALGRLRDPSPHPGARHWTAPPAARLLGLLRFFAANPPAPWAELA
ncbi:phosphotransferase family protein [Streptomyces flavofungini]|uniref:phosphotransferase family protein n=1 Tax=Streptomyces flavofungini TaxID=68200 RepID=UPI0034DEA2B4